MDNVVSLITAHSGARNNLAQVANLYRFCTVSQINGANVYIKNRSRIYKQRNRVSKLIADGLFHDVTLRDQIFADSIEAGFDLSLAEIHPVLITVRTHKQSQILLDLISFMSTDYIGYAGELDESTVTLYMAPFWDSLFQSVQDYVDEFGREIKSGEFEIRLINYKEEDA